MIFTTRGALVRALRSAALALATLALAACQQANPPPPSPLTATTTDGGPDAIPVGQDAVFTVVVSNPGNKEVKHVTIADTVSDNLRFKSMTCSAQGATCPAEGQIMVDSLPPGGVLTFTVTATVNGHPFDNKVDVAATGYDVIFARASNAVADPADGNYQVFVGDGNVVGLKLDVTGHRAGITSTIPQVPVMEMLSDDADGSHHTTTGLHLRTAPGLVVGTYDFGAGPEPFIAFNTPALYISDLDGLSFNTFERAKLASGAVTSRAFATWFSGSTMHVCADAHPYGAASCPGGSQRHYQVTSPTFGSFTATDPGTGDVQHFMLARSGTASILVRADRTAAGTFFATGLQVTNVTPGITADGGSSRGDWDHMVLVATSFTSQPIAADGTLGTPTTHDTLAPVMNGPPGLAFGPRTTDGATLYVATNGTLALAVGAPDGTASGEFHLYAH